MAERQTATSTDDATTMTKREVPFFKPDLGAGEIEEVVAVLRSGWLTTGPRVKQFEREFADAVRAPHALAVNSATAALHVAIEALGIQPGQGVLVPTMTFAATAEVLHYMGAHSGAGRLRSGDPEHGSRQSRGGDRAVRSPGHDGPRASARRESSASCPCTSAG